MAKEIAHLYVNSVFLPRIVNNQTAAIKYAEDYCAKRPSDWRTPGISFSAAMDIIFFPMVLGLLSLLVLGFTTPLQTTLLTVLGVPSVITLTFSGYGLWSHWGKRRQELKHLNDKWNEEYQKTTDRLGLAAKNLTAFSEFFNKQAERFNKYQKYIESGAIVLSDAQWTERKKLCKKLEAIGDNLTKRGNQLDYLLDDDLKPSMDKDVMDMVEYLGQAEIGNEIAKLLDPRFRTLSEAEMETKALAVLEELPQRI